MRSLPFSTDEFFAAIRQCYNRRTQDPRFERLTFCLLGVATPSDLIQDTRTTPFNIGRRIELTDFTAAEVAPLAQGLGRDEATSRLLLERVLSWTGGHPYLTQRLCQAAAEALSQPPNPKSRPTLRVGALQNPKSTVDRLCEELFFSPRAQEHDDNLLFVRERLLKAEGDRAGLLDLYRQVRSGRRIADDESNQLVGILRLSGVTRVRNGYLGLRNRIYARVFDPQWITTHMPDAELRRQRAAYLRGLARAAAVAAVILTVVAGLAVTAVTQARHADRQRRVADQQRHLAQEGQKTLRRHLYAARVKLAQQDWEEEGSTGTTLALLDGLRPEPGQEDLRGFEWRYLWRRCQGGAFASWIPEQGNLTTIALSPDGRTLATGGNATEIRLWEVATQRLIGMLQGHRQNVYELVFSPDGKRLASCSADQSVRLWDAAARRELGRLPGKDVQRLCFSPDGRVLATGGEDRKVRLWEVHTRRLLATFTGHRTGVTSLAFSPDGKTLVSGGSEDGVRFWDLTTRRAGAPLRGSVTDVASVAFSPDGKTLATAGREGFDGAVKLWNVATRRQRRALWGHRGWVVCVRFSPDGKRLASGGDDHTIRVWDLTTHHPVRALRGHRRVVRSLAFSPDGATLASGGEDRTVKLWKLTDQEDPTSVLRTGAAVSGIALSPNGALLAAAGEDGTVRLWEIAARRPVAALKAPRGLMFQPAFSADGRFLAVPIWLGHGEKKGSVIKLWEVATRRELAAIPSFTSLYPGLAFSWDSRQLATVKDDRTVLVWDLIARRQRAAVRVAESPGRLWGLAFAPDGTGLVVGNREAVDRWDIITGRPAPLLRGVPSEGPFLFSPDGKTLATSNWADTLKLWDWKTRQVAATLKRESPARMEVAFSPDARSLAMTNGKNISLWDLASQQEVATLKGHTGPVSGVAFAPDGNLLASGSADGTVRLWRAASFQETDPLRVVANGSDRAVELQWRPVSYASGYNVYRRSGGRAVGRSSGLLSTPERRGRFVKLNAQPVVARSFVDHGPGLVNGQIQTYAVAPILRRTPDGMREGPATQVQAAPIAAPPGYGGCSVAERPLAGSVLFSTEASTPVPTEGGAARGIHPPFRWVPAKRWSMADGGPDEIIVRGSGIDIWDDADECYFLNQPVTGDFQAAVQALSRPTGSSEWAEAGLMVRETFEPGSRHAFLDIKRNHGMHWKWRATTNGYADRREVLTHTQLRLPILLRLTRQGDSIRAETSQDGGRSYQPAGEPVVFEAPLAKTIHVGLAVCSHDSGQISEAKFNHLQIQRR